MKAGRDILYFVASTTLLVAGQFVVPTAISIVTIDKIKLFSKKKKTVRYEIKTIFDIV